jgi:hypothetical protein
MFVTQMSFPNQYTLLDFQDSSHQPDPKFTTLTSTILRFTNKMTEFYFRLIITKRLGTTALFPGKKFRRLQTTYWGHGQTWSAAEF